MLRWIFPGSNLPSVRNFAIPSAQESQGRKVGVRRRDESGAPMVMVGKRIGAGDRLGRFGLRRF